jgi:hypothetical protein
MAKPVPADIRVFFPVLFVVWCHMHFHFTLLFRSKHITRKSFFFSRTYLPVQQL